MGERELTLSDTMYPRRMATPFSPDEDDPDRTWYSRVAFTLFGSSPVYLDEADGARER
jgi:hypothetical protein